MTVIPGARWASPPPGPGPSLLTVRTASEQSTVRVAPSGVDGDDRISGARALSRLAGNGHPAELATKIGVRLSFSRGDLAAKSAIDLGGSGKGRDAERVIFSVKDGVVAIHEIVDYHK